MGGGWYYAGVDPGASNALVTALNALAIALSLASGVTAALAWYFSRAGKIRAFEARLTAQLHIANARIETVEGGFAQFKAEVTGLTDEMIEAHTKAGKERRRIYAENQRAERREASPDAGNGADPDDRESQLRLVRERLHGG